jgi:hypothetical protein
MPRSASYLATLWRPVSITQVTSGTVSVVLRQIGRQNDATAMSGLQRRVLIVCIKPAVERQDRNVSS